MALTLREALCLSACSLFGSGVGSAVPVYDRLEAQPGQRFWHDHRYLCTVAKVWAHYPFAKQERARGVQTRILVDYKLNHTDLLHNSDRSRHLPTLMSTQYSLAWATTRWMMGLNAGQRVHDEYKGSWRSLMDSAQKGMSEAVQSGALEGLPSIQLLDCDVKVTAYGKTILSRCLTSGRACETTGIFLEEDTAELPHFSAEPRLIDVWRFIQLRKRRSVVRPEHPINGFETGLLAVMAFLVDVGVIVDMQAREDAGVGAGDLLDLRGPSGRNRAHHRPVEKLEAIRKAETVHGSDETIWRTSGFHKGRASQLRAKKL